MRLQTSLSISLLLVALLWLGSWSGALPSRQSGGGSSAAAVMVPPGDGGLSGKVIVVDPGHGGGDPGAIGVYGGHEETNTLAIGLDLAALLRRGGARVIMTRSIDRDPATGSTFEHRRDGSLAARVARAEQAGADAFVSIHNNWNQSEVASGTTTFYQRADSVGLARRIQSSEVAALGSDDLGVQYGDFEVIRDTTMPAVLVEVGFISNPIEAHELSQPAYRLAAARGVYNGLSAYFSPTAS